jgi:fructose-bisphosphate aldolase class II
MMDGSLTADGKTPSTFEYNVDVTRKVVEAAHAKGVTVEGEIGVLGGIEDGHGAGGSGLEHVTDPEQAAKFVELTGVDALAIAIGTSHGAYKFSRKPDGAVLKMDRLIEIHNRLPKVHLVMHGSSSVPQDLQDVINKYGGKLRPTWGVPVEEIQLGIRNGVRKVNVDTDNRLAITGAIRKVFAETPEKFDPRDYMKPAREAMQKVVAQRMTQFGQAGHAGDYTAIPLSVMAEQYAA